MISKKFIILFMGLLSQINLQAQNKVSYIQSLQQPNHWADSVFKKLNRREKIAQLFMVRAHTDKGKAYEDSIAKLIVEERIGGLVFFQGGPMRQAQLTNRYQSLSIVPLLIAQDAEWGLAMRLDSTMAFQYQMTLGAIQNNDLIFKMGQEVGRQVKRLGMQVNFAPDVDINSNPKNPVIGYRSFGDNKYNVAAKGAAYMKGMQDAGILVSIKHFPGHGDTDVDSHYDLPQLNFSRSRLDSLELFPFRELIKQDASGVMVAHMNIPALDKTPNVPSTLSKPIITGLLKQELGFKGLVVSDAMEMKGVVKYFPNGDADLRAVIAGNDVIELSQNSKRAMKLIRKSIRKHVLSWDRIDESVKKILIAKYWTGLNKPHQVSTANLLSELNTTDALLLNQTLADAAVTVLKSDTALKSLDVKKKTAIISLGMSELSLFQNQLKTQFTNSTNFVLSKIASSGDINKMLQTLKTYDQVILAIHDYRKRPGSVLDYNSNLKMFIAEMAKMNTISVVFANPYAVAGLPGIENSKILLINYQNSDEMQKAAAKVILGQIKASGKLPVTINAFFKNGDGL